MLRDRPLVEMLGVASDTGRRRGIAVIGKEFLMRTLFLGGGGRPAERQDGEGGKGVQQCPGEPADALPPVIASLS